MITIVAAPCGAGKTIWILQELAQLPTPVVYVTPGVGTVPIDGKSALLSTLDFRVTFGHCLSPSQLELLSRNSLVLAMEKFWSLRLNI